MHLMHYQTPVSMVQRLNTHIGHISKGEPVPQQTLWFSTVNNGFINRLEICLPASGSLALLFHAFGLITEEELDTDHHHYTNESGGLTCQSLASSLCPLYRHSRIMQASVRIITS